MLPAATSFANYLRKRGAVTAVIAAIVLPLGSAAEQPAAVRSGVSSRACPYSCASAGLSRRDCQEWRNGDLCYVQDLRKAEVRKNGFVTFTSCPYDCSTEKIPKGQCRSWELDGRCFVEDLRRAPGGPMEIPAVTAPEGPDVALPIPEKTESPVPSERQSLRQRSDALRSCRMLPAEEIAPPQLALGEVTAISESPIKDQIRISGSVSGRCIAQAGYYEFGRMIHDLRIPLAAEEKSFTFELLGRMTRVPELQVINVYGEKTSVKVPTGRSLP